MEEKRRSRKKDWDVRWGRKTSGEWGSCLEGWWGRSTERTQWLGDLATARPTGDTFSPPHTVARASTGGSREAAAVEGRSGRASGRSPTPEVGVGAHGDGCRKFQAPLAPPPWLGTSHQCPSTGQWKSSRVLSFHETDLQLFPLDAPWIKNMDFRV